jgi:DNA uptake protein ComE-like DNA-binding protein
LEVKDTGPMLSERIQGGRPYKRIDDLTGKKVISKKEFEAIKNMIMVKEK